MLQLNASYAAPCSDNVKKEGDKVNGPCTCLPTGFSTGWDWGKGEERRGGAGLCSFLSFPSFVLG